MDHMTIVMLLLLVTIPTIGTAIEIIKCRKEQEKNNQLLKELIQKLP